MLRILGLIIHTKSGHIKVVTEAHDSGRADGYENGLHTSGVDRANHGYVKGLYQGDPWSAAPASVLVEAQRVVDAYQEE